MLHHNERLSASTGHLEGLDQALQCRVRRENHSPFAVSGAHPDGPYLCNLGSYMKEALMKIRPVFTMVSFLAVLVSIAGTAMAADPEAVDTGTTAWMLTATALVLLMVPGLAMFYGGLVRTKNVLGTMMHSFVAISIIGVLCAVCGYALTFGGNILGGFVGWNSDYFLLKGIDESIVDGVPEYVLAMFQGKFAIITPALISGALAARVYFKGYSLFIVLSCCGSCLSTALCVIGCGPPTDGSSTSARQASSIWRPRAPGSSAWWQTKPSAFALTRKASFRAWINPCTVKAVTA
jgi:hypothetical protein